MRKRPPLRAWAVLPDVDGGSRDRVSATELTLGFSTRGLAGRQPHLMRLEIDVIVDAAESCAMELCTQP